MTNAKSQVWANPFAAAARQLVLTLPRHALVDLRWRHHGLGMLQAELSEDVRIHLWHPSLVDAGMAWPRCVHDHRFDLTSAVIIGEVIDVPCRVVEVEEFDFRGRPIPREAQWVNVYEIEHAKNQDRMVVKGCSTATHAKRLTGAYVEEEGEEHQFAGHAYAIERRRFHTTRVKGFALTVVHRANFDERLARVLCAPDADVTAISGIVRDDSPEHAALVSGVLHEATWAVDQLRSAS